MALAVGSPAESATSSVNSAVAEEAAAARTGNGNSSDSVTEKQRKARGQTAANRGGGHRNAPKSDKGKGSSDRKDAAKDAVATKPKKWGLPLTEYHLTGRFGQSGNKWSSFHHGLDFAAPTGVPMEVLRVGK